MALDYILYIGNTNDICVRNLREASTDIPIDNASFSFTLYDRRGQPVDGFNELELTYESAPGNYRGTSPHTAGIVVKKTYRGRLTGTMGDGSTVLAEADFEVRTR